MNDRAWEMMQHLSELGVGEQPIVWVGHSKGGLFVKQMLVHGENWTKFGFCVTASFKTCCLTLVHLLLVLYSGAIA